LVVAEAAAVQGDRVLVAAVSMGSTSEGEIAVLAGSGGLEAVLVLVAAPSVAAAALVAAASVVSVEQDWAQVVSQDSVVAASVVTIAQPPSAGRAWATICRVSRVQTKGALDGKSAVPDYHKQAVEEDFFAGGGFFGGRSGGGLSGLGSDDGDDFLIDEDEGSMDGVVEDSYE
jgi:hypothetical protein